MMHTRTHIALFLCFVFVHLTGCDAGDGQPAQMIFGLTSYMGFDDARHQLKKQKLMLIGIPKDVSGSKDEDYIVKNTRITGFSSEAGVDVFAIFYRDQLMRVWVRSKDIMSIPDMVVEEFSNRGVLELESNTKVSQGQLMIYVDRDRDGYVSLVVEDKDLSNMYWEETAK